MASQALESEKLRHSYCYQPASLPLGNAVEVPLELAYGQSRQCVDSIESGLTFGMERRDRPCHWL